MPMLRETMKAAALVGTLVVVVGSTMEMVSELMVRMLRQQEGCNPCRDQFTMSCDGAGHGTMEDFL